MIGFAMRDNYDFSDSVKNPYAKRLKKQITIRLDEDTIAYFKAMKLINLPCDIILVLKYLVK